MPYPALISLLHDHHEVLILIMKCRKRALGQIKPPRGVEGLIDVVQEMRDFRDGRLERHFQAEERVVFPLLNEACAESRPMTAALYRDHERIRKVSLESAGAYLSKALFDLADLLERHVRREERELFPLFEGISGIQAERVKKNIEEILWCKDGESRELPERRDGKGVVPSTP